MLEAEVKLQLDGAREGRLRARLDALGATPHGADQQSDLYLAHPARDFGATDEALRLRQSRGRVQLTWKGPKLDPPFKTREEIEIDAGTDFDQARSLFERLGFTPVAEVHKRRESWQLPAPAEALVVIDAVDGLGSYCEVEVLATTAAEGRSRLEALLGQLELADLPPVATSYLELLLAADARDRRPRPSGPG